MGLTKLCVGVLLSFCIGSAAAEETQCADGACHVEDDTSFLQVVLTKSTDGSNMGVQQDKHKLIPPTLVVPPHMPELEQIQASEEDASEGEQEEENGVDLKVVKDEEEPGNEVDEANELSSKGDGKRGQPWRLTEKSDGQSSGRSGKGSRKSGKSSGNRRRPSRGSRSRSCNRRRISGRCSTRRRNEPPPPPHPQFSPASMLDSTSDAKVRAREEEEDATDEEYEEEDEVDLEVRRRRTTIDKGKADEQQILATKRRNKEKAASGKPPKRQEKAAMETKKAEQKGDKKMFA